MCRTMKEEKNGEKFGCFKKIMYFCSDKTLMCMTTIDLRMELAQEIQNIPDSEQLLLRVINYVRSITKKDDDSLTLTGDALRLWNRTMELSNLQAGWDGAGARPMHKKVVQNVQRVIKAGISSDFQNWVLSSVVVRLLRRRRRTTLGRNWPESEPLRWKARLEHRRNTTPCEESRQGRRKRRSCTSSSASIPRT